MVADEPDHQRAGNDPEEGRHDEAHERHLDSDLGLALAIEAQGVLRDDLRLVVMSATIDGSRFAALLDQAPRAAQARATADCVLVVFFRADFMNLLETHPKVASKIALSLARHLGGRLRQANAGTRLDGHL